VSLARLTGTYLGGYPAREEAKVGATLLIAPEGLEVRGVRRLLIEPWANVTSVEAEGADEVGERLTAARYANAGRNAYRWQTDKNKAFVVVQGTFGEFIMHIPKRTVEKLRDELAFWQPAIGGDSLSMIDDERLPATSGEGFDGDDILALAAEGFESDDPVLVALARLVRHQSEFVIVELSGGHPGYVQFAQGNPRGLVAGIRGITAEVGSNESLGGDYITRDAEDWLGSHGWAGPRERQPNWWRTFETPVSASELRALAFESLSGAYSLVGEVDVRVQTAEEAGSKQERRESLVRSAREFLDRAEAASAHDAIAEERAIQEGWGWVRANDGITRWLARRYEAEIADRTRSGRLRKADWIGTVGNYDFWSDRVVTDGRVLPMTADVEAQVESSGQLTITQRPTLNEWLPDRSFRDQRSSLDSRSRRRKSTTHERSTSLCNTPRVRRSSNLACMRKRTHAGLRPR
jgi:hypothetical protein